MTSYDAVTSLSFAPLLPWAILFGLFAISLFLLFLGWRARLNGLPIRALLFVIVATLLMNPTLQEEQRAPLNDVALIIVDETDSQKIGNRLAQTRKTAEDLAQKLTNEPNLDIQVITVTSPIVGDQKDEAGSLLFSAWRQALKNFDKKRVAATFMITDGQIHDIPNSDDPFLSDAGPVHFTIAGNKDATDRVLELISPPTFAIVDKPFSLRFKVTENPAADENTPAIIVSAELQGEVIRQVAVEAGRVFEMDLVLPHAGANHIVLRASERDGEISTLNNMAVAEINAVRDRLRVLLVSGEPHMGERGWRNILKSDPSVDLVHFTILRPPEKQDGTPLNELSLIPFPIMELFERKLHEFDLVVFDRYRKRGVLTNRYLENIVEYVNGGGALLEAAGPSFASPLSLYRTPLASLLPGAPTGAVIETRFTPTLSQNGERHPVTGDLTPQAQSPKWGPWFRLIDVNTTGGTVLMTGADEKPLLVLKRSGKGRIAQLTSDHAWLWGRGYEGGGPQAELFRRIAHWLMQEPDLEEEKLLAERDGSALAISRRSMQSDQETVSITYPDGSQQTATLSEFEKGTAYAKAPLKGVGLYQVTSGGLQTLVAIGTLNPIENRNVLSTDEQIMPISEMLGGGIIWQDTATLPDLRQVSENGPFSGRNWWGLRRNDAYEISGYNTTPLLPIWLAMILLGIGLLFMWWRESK